MKSKFPGFPPETRKFLRNLKRNNRREWFQPRKETFDEVVKGPMTELVLALGEAMRDFAPELNTDPKKPSTVSTVTRASAKTRPPTRRGLQLSSVRAVSRSTRRPARISTSARTKS